MSAIATWRAGTIGSGCLWELMRLTAVFSSFRMVTMVPARLFICGCRLPGWCSSFVSELTSTKSWVARLCIVSVTTFKACAW